MKNATKEYELLQEKYDKLWCEKQSLEYELNQLKQKENYFDEQSSQILALHESVRSIKHDMKNHMLILATYLDEGNYDEARVYTSKILDNLNAIHSYIQTDNSLMNYILNQKLEEARKNHISIKAEIENLAFKRVESMDFTAILSNLLDNAIEACEKETVKDLEVVIGKRRGYETILVKNRIEKSVLANNKELLTQKDDKELHGFGIKQIKALTNKYDGLCDFYEENQFFCACVFIPE